MTIVKGDRHEFTTTFVDADGNAFNLSGYTVMFTAKKSYSLTDAEANISTAGTVADAALGVAAFVLTPDETTIEATKYYYDTQVSDGGDNVHTPSGTSGILTITEQVTIDK